MLALDPVPNWYWNVTLAIVGPDATAWYVVPMGVPIIDTFSPGLNLTRCVAADGPAKQLKSCFTTTFLLNIADTVESHGPAAKLIVPGELLRTIACIRKKLPT